MYICGEKISQIGNVLVTTSDRNLLDNSAFIADVTATNDYYPFGMSIANRSFSSGGYRYGFRIYNPSLGKFLSVDPIANEYPFYSTYHFAGNMPIFAKDLDGREPDVINGKLVGYRIKADQGPTHIAKDINNPDNQKKYGYCLIEPIEWTELIDDSANQIYWGAQNISGDRYDKHNDDYKHVAIHPGELVNIVGDCDDCSEPTPPEEPKREVVELEQSPLSEKADMVKARTYSFTVNDAFIGGGE